MAGKRLTQLRIDLDLTASPYRLEVIARRILKLLLRAYRARAVRIDWTEPSDERS